MRARKWLWRILVALCALVVLAAWVARPDDPYAKLRRLASREKVFRIEWPSGGTRTVRVFHFTVPLSRVEAVLPPLDPIYPYLDGFRLPNGDGGMLHTPPRGPTNPFPLEDSCYVNVYESPPRPWYAQAWQTLRRRLRL